LQLHTQMIETKQYKNFINGRYFSEGIRMTAGIVLPALILGYFDMLDIGVVMSTGALCVSVTDSPGPVHHRVNGMFFCNIIIGIVAIISYFAFYSEITTAAVILLFGFTFSMLSVYNARVSSVGVSALLIMILCMQTPLRGTAIFVHTLYLIIGGAWYLLFSIALNTLRPYKIIQQLSGDFIADVAAYLKTRASFYQDHPDYENIYRSLLQQQVKVQTHQAALSEMLFKTRAITRNSTQIGRSLLKIYLDISDLFESIMSTYQQYEILHKKFDETGILELYREQLILLSDELTGLGDAVRAGERSVSDQKAKDHLAVVRKRFEELRHDFMNEKNIKDFISLGRIYNNIRGLTEKITGLHYYTAYDKKNRIAAVNDLDLMQFAEAQTIAPALFLNNLNFNSNVFRHSLRVAFSLLAGYLLSLFFDIGHSYWILLTIVVILKPAYSLTKSRNTDRLLGTVAGILIGVGLLFVFKNEKVLLALMIILMALAYMFIRTRYFLSVLFMTPYLVIFFHFLSPGSIRELLLDRTIDTALGSGIAFLSSLFFVPAWEHTTIRSYMIIMLQKDIEYYNCISQNFIADIAVKKENLKKSRQQSLTALANLSDAFNRMLSEPKRFQKKSEFIYRFVVLNHIITSHFSALAFYLNEQKAIFRSPIFASAAEATKAQLENAIDMLENEKADGELISEDAFDRLNDETASLLALRRQEIASGNLETETKKELIQKRSVIDQFSYIYNLTKDIEKNVRSFTENEKAV
jgi:uncharacterized membrane protein YccC